MTVDKTKLFLAVLVTAFTAEHIWLVTRPSPPAIDAVTCVVKVVK